MRDVDVLMRDSAWLWLAVFLLSLGLQGCGSESVPRPPAGPSDVPTPTPSPTVSPSPAPNQAPVLEVRVTPTPIAGQAPLGVSVNLCRSYDPEGDPLSFVYEYQGEGKRFSSQCQERHVYPQAVQSRAVFCVSDGQPRHLICRTFKVSIE